MYFEPTTLVFPQQKAIPISASQRLDKKPGELGIVDAIGVGGEDTRPNCDSINMSGIGSIQAISCLF